MTNLERNARGISPSDLCSHCHLYPESIVHVLCDCEVTLEMWERIVDPDLRHAFASLGLQSWLLFNLQLESMGNLQRSLPIIFTSMIHLLWIECNHFVFSGKFSIPRLISS